MFEPFNPVVVSLLIALSARAIECVCKFVQVRVRLSVCMCAFECVRVFMCVCLCV